MICPGSTFSSSLPLLPRSVQVLVHQHAVLGLQLPLQPLQLLRVHRLLLLLIYSLVLLQAPSPELLLRLSRAN